MQEIKVESTTLDSFCIENTISKVDFLKIDVEGAEHSVIIGGNETICKHRPLIYYECHYGYANKLDEVIQTCQTSAFLNNINYQFFIVKNDSTLVKLKLNDVPGKTDLFAIPSEKVSNYERYFELS